jgi:hypothetical protein
VVEGAAAASDGMQCTSSSHGRKSSLTGYRSRGSQSTATSRR